MGIALSQIDDSSQIRLEGAIDISSAAELKAALLKAIEAGKEIRITAGEVTGLDITAFQLLWATEREAKRLGVGFALTGKLPEAVQRSLVGMGLDGFAVLTNLRGS